MRLLGIVGDLLKTSDSISTVPWASFHGFWGFPWVLQGFCGFSSIGFGLPCFCKYYKVLQSITPYYYTVILRPRKSTILCLYYTLTLPFFDSTILYSTILSLCDIVRILEISQLNFLWWIHIDICILYLQCTQPKKWSWKITHSKSQKKCGCVFFVVKDLQFS